MSISLIIISIVLSGVGFALALFLALETLAALLPARLLRDDTKPGPLVVLIPAHNEAMTIGATLENVRGQLRVDDRMLVVADNCTDETAKTARNFGAEIVERNDMTRRGKGFALQFGLDALRAAPPELVIFLDADCLFATDALQRTASIAASEHRPAQALYLMKAPQGAGPRLQVSEFAWLLINNVRMRGLQRVFDVSRFTGAGLAVPWSLLEGIELGSGEIVEDLALSTQLARRGAAPVLVCDAIVESEFPTDELALTRQAARWSIGSLRYSARTALSLLIDGIKTRKIALVGAAIDLMIPPLTVFAAALLAVSVFALFVWGVTGVSVGFALSFWALFFAGGSVAIAWVGFGRDALPPSALGGVFSFIISKVSVFGEKGRHSTKSWTPTRDGTKKADD